MDMPTGYRGPGLREVRQHLAGVEVDRSPPGPGRSAPTKTSSKPASTYSCSALTCTSGSGPHGHDSRRSSPRSRAADACSKCAGVGRICASSPGRPELAHSRWAVLRRTRPRSARSSTSSRRSAGPSRPRCGRARGARAFGLGASRSRRRCGPRARSPSAPKPETMIGGSSSGRRVDAGVLDAVVRAVVGLDVRPPTAARMTSTASSSISRRTSASRPAVAEDVLVQRLAAADAEAEAAGHHRRRRRRRLGHDRRVDAHRRAGDGGQPAHRARGLRDAAEHAPHERALALLVVPGVEVVGDPRRCGSRPARPVPPRRPGPSPCAPRWRARCRSVPSPTDARTGRGETARRAWSARPERSSLSTGPNHGPPHVQAARRDAPPTHRLPREPPSPAATTPRLGGARNGRT